MDETHISKLNRSFARSEPNLPHCRQINVTEYFGQNPHNHLWIRHLSFKELRGDFEESSQCFTSNNSQFEYPIHANSPQICEINDQLYTNDYYCDETLKKDFNDSPMDIDQSGECMDVSMKQNGRLHVNEINVKSLNSLNGKVEIREGVKKVDELIKSNTRKRLSKKMGMAWTEIILTVILGVFISLGFLIYTDINLSDIHLKDIENDLKLNIFNQNHIVDRLVFNLNKIHTNTEFKKILILVGSTGVGKTLILNRLKKIYPEKLLISLNYLTDKDIVEQKNTIFFTNKCFILLIDNLKINQLEIIENFIKKLQSECVFIILAFNIQDTNNNLTHIIRYEHFKEISQFFTQKNSFSETLMLNVMNKKNLEFFITDIIKNRGKNPEKYNDFITNLIQNHDVDNYGFKGIIPKINLLD